MLERLEVRDLGIIDHAVLEPVAGLLALTGETGAGKSLVVGSLALLGGQRASVEMVRSGAAKARVDGAFSGVAEDLLEELSELGIDHDPSEALLLSREVLASGRSRAWIDGTPVSNAQLAAVASRMIAIHGQHEQLELGDPRRQLAAIDACGDESHRRLLVETEQCWVELERARVELEGIRREAASRRDRLDVIAFQIAEIDAVGARSGEIESLESRRKALGNAQRLSELGVRALPALNGDDGARTKCAEASRLVEQMCHLGLDLSAAAAALAEATVGLDEAGEALERGLDGLEHDPEEIEAIGSRLFRLEGLVLKYGGELDEVLAYRESIGAEQERLFAIDDELEAADRALASALQGYEAIAKALDSSRRQLGEALLEEVGRYLAELHMGESRLGWRWYAEARDGSLIQREGRPVSAGPDGVELAELEIAANPGEPLKSLAKIASGGELSRVQLALVCAARSFAPGRGRTLLFDEVDAGIGGAAAAALGRLLRRIATGDQVLVVTHLPQVAAQAAVQIRVSKQFDGERTTTRLDRLETEARVDELARMLSGDQAADVARDHARALLE